MADCTSSGRRARPRCQSSESTARSEALERLRAMRAGGARAAAAWNRVKVDAPIYDTVEEDEYEALVSRRREDARNFIVDDDGRGYADEGQEEDWTVPDHSSSEDGVSDDEKRPRKKKKTAAQKNQSEPPKKAMPTAASAAAAQRLSSMFAFSMFKKNERSNVTAGAADSIVNDVIAEFVPDETDRNERRRRSSGTRVPKGSLISLPTSAEPIKIEHQSHTPPVTELADAQMLQLEYPTEVEANHKGISELDSNRDSAEAKIPEIKTETIDNGREAANATARADASVKVEKAFSINAKINAEKDKNMTSAVAGWKDICNVGDAIVGTNQVDDSNTTVEKSELVTDSDGSLPFYMIDAYEETFGTNMGTLYLFGKVKDGNSYYSCCVIIKNMQRCVYAIPNSSVFPSNKIAETEREVAGNQLNATVLSTTLQDMASELKNEIATRLLELNVSNFSMAPVKRGYAFERSDIPAGEQFVLKVNYPFKDSPLPSDIKGDHFVALFGTHTSALELFLIKRKIKGPSWLTVLKHTSPPTSQRVSWCKFEIVVGSPKEISIYSSKTSLDIPPAVVAAINLKTIINDKHNVNEIVSASVICCQKAKIDGPMTASEWKKPGMLNRFTILRKLEGGIFPSGLRQEVTDRNSKAGTHVLKLESSERALLHCLMTELHCLDCDVLVGHNISGFDLDILLHRAQVCKVPSSMWSKIGRLKRSVMPKLSKGSTIYGSGANPGIMSCLAGRLLCDTYLCSRDLLREVSYSLTQLAKTQLNRERKEIPPRDVPAMFQSSLSLIELVECGETDAWLSLELMFHLSILPLTRQLTNISGNLWGRTLQCARAQRVEFLLLHSFHAKKYIVPDKLSTRNKESKTTKRKVNGSVDEEADNLDVNDNYLENDAHHIDQGKGKNGPSYSGGLVLEPKKGLYDKYVLLLDFNSLYPSIIQEYNICFTTVERSSDGLIPNFPSSQLTGVLPELLRNLVERRRMVKGWLKTATGLKIQQLDIQQQALKLTANSMYGCLGFSNSRFYAKPLAELITLQGREILQHTVDLVQNILNLEVIYGDTDSIMIYTGLDDIGKAKAIAGKVIQEVNKNYRCLEIDLDGLYKRMLLLKKKKYAALKLLFKDGSSYEVIERKGLDMVRRDWSLLSKELGDFCLNQILSEGTCEDVVESIHSSLMKVQEEMRNGEIALEKYVITKTLTKQPEDYADAKNQPHVQVALRLKQYGSFGCSAGDTIPYIICCQQGENFGSATGIAQRARHPDELKKEDGNWMIDIDYYLSQQIHPVVSRLCASIQGTSPARLADCLGLDSSKFQSKTSISYDKDPSVISCEVDEDERYHGCEPLHLLCPSCCCKFECPPMSSLLASCKEDLSDQQIEKVPGYSFWRSMLCPKCSTSDDVGCRINSAMMANQVKKQVDHFISLYYKGLMTCDDEMCKYTTRSLNLRVMGDSDRGTICPNYPRCNGHLIRQYTEADLYRQLSYFSHVLDAARFVDKVDPKIKNKLENELRISSSLVEVASSYIQKIRDRCAYGWVQMKELTVSL